MAATPYPATTVNASYVPHSRTFASASYSELRQKLVREHPFLVAQVSELPKSTDAQSDQETETNGEPSGSGTGNAGGTHTETSLNDAVVALTQPGSTRSHAFGPSYVPKEQTMRPDHPWNYSASAFKDLPANAVRNRNLDGRFTESVAGGRPPCGGRVYADSQLSFTFHRYPKLHRLLEIKRGLVDASASPATYLATDLRDSLGPPPSNAQRPAAGDGAPFHLASLMPVKYDVVLIDAPLPCYGE